MHILVSNDDGVNAEGIQCLQSAMADLGDVTVVAPDRDRSAASHSLTVRYPLRIQRHANGFIGVEGTPTDSVHIALTALLDKKPDLVVAGINHGANLGDDTLYSGTVAAAMEGANMGVPAIAMSLAGNLDYFATASAVAKQIVTQLDFTALPSKCLLNINVPGVPLADLQGFEVTRLGARHHAEPTLTAKDPRGERIYWIGPPAREADAGPGTDFHAIREGKVSITPLQFDLTDYRLMDRVAGVLKDIMV
jgi:5'/3'-nucleotidase